MKNTILTPVSDDLLNASGISQKIIESIGLGVIVVDTDGNINYVSESFCRLAGCAREDVLLKPVHVFFSGKEEQQLLLGKVSDRKTGKSERYAFNATSANGKLLNIEVDGFPIRDKADRIIGSVAILNDVTEKTDIQRELQSTADHLNRIVGNISEVFFSMDMAGNKYLLVSPSCEKVYGYTQDEFYADPQLWYNVIHPDDQELVAVQRNALFEGQSVDYEYRIVRKDGHTCWVEARIVPTMDDKGMLLRIDGSVADITVRRMAEDKLKEKVNEMNTFIYKASHDLRAPISSLLGLINLAIKETKTDMPWYLDMIRQSTQKMDEILQGLMSPVMMQQDKVRESDIDFSGIVSDIFAGIKFMPRFDEMEFNTDISMENVFRSDKQLVFSILSNLITNAIKYSRPVKKPEISIHISENNGGVTIKVSDNGIGIPVHLQQKIFDMFYRATDISEGSGLGLYIVKSAVDKLHGTIRVNSAEKMGTIFTVFLPGIVPGEKTKTLDNRSDISGNTAAA